MDNLRKAALNAVSRANSLGLRLIKNPDDEDIRGRHNKAVKEAYSLVAKLCKLQMAEEYLADQELAA